MNNPDLKNLLKIYEQKRLTAQKNYEAKIDCLYQENPNLSNLVDQINQTAINLSKSILLNDSDKIAVLQEKLASLKIEKANLLHKLNINDSFWETNYECKKCNDTGYLIDDNSIMCTCLKQKLIDLQYNKSNISRLENENFDTFNFDIFSDIADEKKYNSNLSPRENMKQVKDIAIDFIKNFDKPEEKNLLFTGNTGLGKTFLSNCIANEILQSGKTVLYQTAPVLLDAIIDYRFGKTDSFIYNNILNADLLIIDDLGTENLNSIKFTELFNVINTRYSRRIK